MPKEKKVKWVVQKNLTNPAELEALRLACTNAGIDCREINIVPFTNELPELEITPCTIYYGSTTFNRLVYENKKTRSGLFFDNDTFLMERYMKEWGKYMLNYSATITTIGELVNYSYGPDKLLFLRPNDDSKSFAGEVLRFGDVREWYEGVKAAENFVFSPDTKILVSEPYQIDYEWRLWIVDKKVVTASQYRKNFKLNKARGCPPEVISFAEERCREFTPHNVFVMDICLSAGEYYILECGCMNGAGFYNADIEAIVRTVSDWFGNTCNA